MCYTAFELSYMNFRESRIEQIYDCWSSARLLFLGKDPWSFWTCIISYSWCNIILQDLDTTMNATPPCLTAVWDTKTWSVCHQSCKTNTLVCVKMKLFCSGTVRCQNVKQVCMRRFVRYCLEYYFQLLWYRSLHILLVIMTLDITALLRFIGKLHDGLHTWNSYWTPVFTSYA